MRKSALKRWAAAAALLGLAASGCSTVGAGVMAEPTALPTATTPSEATVPPSEAVTAVAVVTTDAGAVYPIFEGQTGFLLGGVKNGQWLDAVTTASMITGAMDYRVFTGSSQTGQVSGTIFTPDESMGPCAEPQVETGSAEKQPGSIAVTGDWNVVPRTPESLSTDIPDYRAAIETVLAQNGIAMPEVILTGAYRVDLEGDGTDEVLISASRLTGGGNDGYLWPAVAEGDYTLVALRKVAGQGAETLPFILTTYPQASELSYPWRPTILGMLDLNGDGRLEIILVEDAFEGRIVEVYEVNGKDVKMVLSGGCSI